MSVTAPIVKAFVVEAASSQVVVQLIDDTFQGQLVNLGFGVTSSGPPKVLSRAVASQTEKAQLFASLRDEGVCFSAGPDWCPADVFEYLRDQGVLLGNYRRIAWKAPGQPMIVDNC